MQLFSQHAHNLCGRVVFLQDHEFFNDSYTQASKDYDDVIERMIGLMGEKDLELNALLTEVMKELKDAPSVNVKENAIFYKYLLGLEVKLCEAIKKQTPSSSVGTQQLIGDIANLSEGRQYKIKQRLKNG